MSANTEFRLPDLLENWPWSRCLSPYYEEAKGESSSWVRSFLPFDQKGQRAFDACDLSKFWAFHVLALYFLTTYCSDLLASLTYPRRNRGNGVASNPPAIDQFRAEFIRVGCDLMNFYFVYDEYTDVSDEATAHRLANIVLNAMHHPLAEPTAEEHVH